MCRPAVVWAVFMGTSIRLARVTSHHPLGRSTRATQASTEAGAIILVERAEQSGEAAEQAAAPNPPSTALTFAPWDSSARPPQPLARSPPQTSRSPPGITQVNRPSG